MLSAASAINAPAEAALLSIQTQTGIERIDGGDTVWRWHRDPLVAEAMVGRSAGDSTTLRVLTLTADEAVQRHFSEGSASSVAEVLQRAGVEDYTLYVYEPTTLDRVLGWLMNPVAQGIFIMLIIGGIYFELQTPGIGFPLVVAVLGAVLYFAPLYLEGVAQNWELLLFVVGLLLLAVEIFVLPGFGIAGVAGIAAVVTGLAFAAIDNELFRHVTSGEEPVKKRRPSHSAATKAVTELTITTANGRTTHATDTSPEVT